jgi:hypothetical protein
MTPANQAPSADGESGNRRGLRIAAGSVVGLGLIALAVWAVLGQRTALHHGLAAARAAPSWLPVALLLLPLANLALTSAQFWVLTCRFRRVPLGDMALLIASAWLLNTLPLRAGMIGRVAYHKAVHGVPVRDSLRVLIWSMLLAGVSVLTLLGITLATHAARLDGGATAAVLVLPAAACGVVAWGLGRRRTAPHLWRWPAALGLRYLDMTVWALRYSLAFNLIGHPLRPTSAAAVALTGQAAMVSPVQLGLREWVVGATAALLPEGIGSTNLEAMAPGLMADLVNRAAELACAVPLGAAAAWILYRRWARRVELGPASAL